MSELAQLTRRVTRLEKRMDDVQDLAGRTGQEVADWRTTLNLHTQTLNAMGEKIDLFQKRVDKRFAEVDERLDKLEAKVEDGFAKVDENFAEVNRNFAKVDENFAKVEKKFQLLHQGQDRITKLLTRYLGEPGAETRPGGPDE